MVAVSERESRRPATLTFVKEKWIFTVVASLLLKLYRCVIAFLVDFFFITGVKDDVDELKVKPAIK